MSKLIGLTLFGLTLAALGFASRRIATHQAVLPELTTKVNTRVTRINQR
jgi:hypothetical protein